MSKPFSDEPWQEPYQENYPTLEEAPHFVEDIGYFFEKEDAERAVECVNALAGVESPLQFLSDIRDSMGRLLNGGNVMSVSINKVFLDLDRVITANARS